MTTRKNIHTLDALIHDLRQQSSAGDHAAKVCGFVVTEFNRDQYSKADLAKWEAALLDYRDRHPEFTDSHAGQHGRQYFGVDEAEAAGLLKPGACESLREDMKANGEKLIQRVRKERADTAALQGENPAIVAAIRATGVRFPDVQYVMIQGPTPGNNWFIIGEVGEAWVAAVQAYLAEHPETHHSFAQRIQELFTEARQADFSARGLSMKALMAENAENDDDAENDDEGAEDAEDDGPPRARRIRRRQPSIEGRVQPMSKTYSYLENLKARTAKKDGEAN